MLKKLFNHTNEEELKQKVTENVDVKFVCQNWGSTHAHREAGCSDMVWDICHWSKGNC